MIEFW